MSETKLKSVLLTTCELFDEIDKTLEIMNKANSKGSLSNVLKFELLSFLCCLSACDGRISKVEAKLIRDNFDLEMYPVHIKDFYHEHSLGDDEYFKKTPQCLKLAVKVDNHMINQGTVIDKGISEIVIELFKIFGKAMVVADDKVKAEEQICWSRYISMMTQYLADKSLIYTQRPETVPRPGTPIEVDYQMSLDKIGRIYTLYVGKFPIES